MTICSAEPCLHKSSLNEYGVIRRPWKAFAVNPMTRTEIYVKSRLCYPSEQILAFSDLPATLT